MLLRVDEALLVRLQSALEHSDNDLDVDAQNQLWRTNHNRSFCAVVGEKNKQKSKITEDWKDML